jgi:hypothetical protein
MNEIILAAIIAVCTNANKEFITDAEKVCQKHVGIYYKENKKICDDNKCSDSDQDIIIKSYHKFQGLGYK